MKVKYLGIEVDDEPLTSQQEQLILKSKNAMKGFLHSVSVLPTAADNSSYIRCMVGGKFVGALLLEHNNTNNTVEWHMLFLEEAKMFSRQLAELALLMAQRKNLIIYTVVGTGKRLAYMRNFISNMGFPHRLIEREGAPKFADKAAHYWVPPGWAPRYINVDQVRYHD